MDGSYAEYGEALKLKPNDPAAVDGQKKVVLVKDWNQMEAAWGKDDEAAIAALEQIMRLDPGYREAQQKLYALLITKADRLLSAGVDEAAFEVLMRAKEVDPDGEEAIRRLTAYTPTPGPTPLQTSPACPGPPASTAAPPGPRPLPRPTATEPPPPPTRPPTPPPTRPPTPVRSPAPR